MGPPRTVRANPPCVLPEHRSNRLKTQVLAMNGLFTTVTNLYLTNEARHSIPRAFDKDSCRNHGLRVRKRIHDAH